jgi:hypothetical protein
MDDRDVRPAVIAHEVESAGLEDAAALQIVEIARGSGLNATVASMVQRADYSALIIREKVS